VIENLKPVDVGILLAAAVMALGAFCPIIILPIIGSLSYVMRGNGDGMVIVGCSAAIVPLTIFGYRRTTAIVAAGALMMMFYTLAGLAGLLSKAQADMVSAKSGAFGGLASIMINSVGLGWGWVLMFGGAFGVLALALLANASAPAPLFKTVQSEPEPASTSFSSADQIIAEYIENRAISPAIRNGEPKPGFGKRVQPN
jgi:uncharacterized membrane protein